jgi:pterin-4a-carbinolamine dehydratase
MSRQEAEGLKITLDDAWRIEFNDDDDKNVPSLLVREFIHADYLAGARFLHKIAAVAQIRNHFPPSVRLERRIVKKSWQTVSRIECRTTVLEGLSRHDFHLAMVRTSTSTLSFVRSFVLAVS